MRGLRLIGDDRRRVDGVIRGEGLVIRLGVDHANLGGSPHLESE